MLKKFLNDESKSPVIDFLLWLIVYPFVIVFAVACAINIFQFSVFQNIKFTDWIMAGGTFLILIGTWKAASYAKKAADQAQIQNNYIVVSKIEDLYTALESGFREIESPLQNVVGICKQIRKNNFEFTQAVEDIRKELNKVEDSELIKNLNKSEPFIDHILDPIPLRKIKASMLNIALSSMLLLSDRYSESEKVDSLLYYCEEYIESIRELLVQVKDKYQELNSIPSKPENV